MKLNVNVLSLNVLGPTLVLIAGIHRFIPPMASTLFNPSQDTMIINARPEPAAADLEEKVDSDGDTNMETALQASYN